MYLTGRQREDELSLDERSAIEYIAGLMAEFIPVGRIFKPDELYTNLYSFTEQWLTRQNERHPSRRVADFLLFMRGNFDEKLKREKSLKFFEKVGAGLYWRLSITERGFFRYRDAMLAENFTAYAEAIKHTGKSRLCLDDMGRVEIVPYRANLKIDQPPLYH